MTKITVLLLFTILCFGAIPLSFGQDAKVTQYFTNVELSNDQNWPHHVEPTMAIGEDGTIYVGYKNALTDVGGGYQVSYTYSTDGGENWAEAVDMSDLWTDARQSDPWMVTYGDTLYYLYLEFDDYGKTQMTMAFTDNKGTTWTKALAGNNTGFADKETFTIDQSGNIYIAYDDVKNLVDTRLSRSFDGGKTFFDNVSIVSQPGDFLGPYIIAGQEPGELFVSYTSLANTGSLANDVYFTRSTDYGATWTEGIDINPEYNASAFTSVGLSPSRGTLTAMEQDKNGRIYLVWADVSNPDGTFDVLMRYSDDKGDSWSDRFLVCDYRPNKQQWMPDLEIDDTGKVHLAYYETYEGLMYVNYRVFNPATETFSDTIEVNDFYSSSNFTRPGDYLTIKLDSNNIPQIVWSDARDSYMDIYYGHLTTKEAPTSSKKGIPLGTMVWIISLVIVGQYQKLISIKRTRNKSKN